MMAYLQRLMSVFLLAALAATASAAEPATPKNGADYLTLPTPQPTDTGKKVEVIEFFAYYCPHCNAFEPLLQAWVKRQGDNIVFRRVHVPRDEDVLPQQRLYYTLESLGLLDKYHARVFAAMHGDQRLRLNRDEQVIDWAAGAGIDRDKFVEAYRSFGVQARVRRADAMVAAYHIDHWPNLAIDGKYLTSPYIANQAVKEPGTETQQQQRALQVMDYLVARARAEKQ